MDRLRLDLQANKPYDFYGPIGYLRILKSTGAVRIDTDTDISTELYAGLGGDMAKPVFAGEDAGIVVGRRLAKRVTVTSETAQYVEILISSFESTDQQTAGEVAIQPRDGMNALPEITAATGGATIAANASRTEIVLYADAGNTGSFWVGGVVGQGVPIRPGGQFQVMVRGAVDLIADQAADKLYALEIL